MNYFSIIVFVVLLGFTAYSNAQTPKIATSDPLEEYKNELKLIDEYITTIDGNHFYSANIRKFKSHYHLKRFDANFKEVLDQEIKVDKKGVTAKFVFGLEQTIYMLTLHDDIKEQKHTYHIAAFDKEIEMIGGVTIADFSIASRKYEPISHLYFSKDSSLIALVSYANDKDSKNVDFDIYVNVVDRKLNKTDSYQRKLPYNQQQFNYLDSWVDATGGVYVFGAVKVSNKEYKYVVFSIKDNKAKEIIVDMGDTHALSFTIGSSSGSNFIIAGFTAEDFREISTGYFLTEIDPAQNTVVNAVTHKFSQSDLKYFKDKGLNREKGKLKGLNAKFPVSRLLHACLNDQYVLNIESSYYIDKQNTRYFYTQSTLNLVFDKDLKLTDKFVIPRDIKLQIGDTRTTSFCDGNAIYYLFNDHADNIKVYDHDKIKNMNSLSTCIPVLYQYDINKKVKKFPITNRNYLISTNSIKKIDSNKIGFALNSNANWGLNGMLLGIVDLE